MAGTPVMSDSEAAQVFDSLENGTFVDAETALPDGFEKATATVTHPNNLPHKLMKIYDTHTGVESLVLPLMVPKVMEQRHPDGTRMYSRTRTVEPPQGTSFCFLHPEYPDRELVVKAGLGGSRCSKPTALISVLHAERHAEHRHKDEYQVYKRFLDAERQRVIDAREEEDREFRRLQMEVMRKQLGETSPRKAG